MCQARPGDFRSYTNADTRGCLSNCDSRKSALARKPPISQSVDGIAPDPADISAPPNSTYSVLLKKSAIDGNSSFGAFTSSDDDEQDVARYISGDVDPRHA